MTVPLTFTCTLCKSTGENVEDLTKVINRRFVQQLNLPSGFSLWYDLYGENYASAIVDASPRLKVWRPSTDAELAGDPTTVRQLVFYGVLPSDATAEDADYGFIDLQFQEPTCVFADRNLTANVTYTQIDQGTILWNLIALQNARTNGDTWIKQGNTATGILRDRTYVAGKNLAELVSEMTKVDGGCDVDFVPVDYYSVDGSRSMGVFSAFAKQGTDKPLARFVYADSMTQGQSGGLDSNVKNIKRRRAKALTMATSVGVGGIVQSYQNTGSGFGLNEEYETFSDVSVLQTLMDKSVGKVLNRQSAPQVFDIIGPTPEAPQPFYDYNIGDTVYLTVRAGGFQVFNQPVRVMGIDIGIGQEGQLTDTKILVATP